MTSIKEKVANISSLIEKQLPDFVVEDNPKFISFLSSYYESQEIKYNSLDLISNLIDYYNIGSYSINDLTQYTNLQSEIANTSDTITVISTHGFPSKNGYISINGEIIFYKEKTNTEFLNCVRGTSAFIFESIPYSQVVYKQGSVASSHIKNSQVVNIAYYFTQEFLRRIKSEISPNLPEVLSKELNLITFLKNVKSFYSSKGSEESHKLLFRILFNDKKVKIRLTPRGSGARVDIVNYTGKIDTFSLMSGGSDYYYEVDNTGNLVSEPLIQVVGSGTGKKLPGEVVVPSSAQMKVTEMTSAGTITKVEIINEGENYIGPISTRIRPRSFSQDQRIYNEDSNKVITGTAKVDTWDPGTNELILYDVVGYFKVDDKIIGEGGENPRGFISKAYPVTDINKEGNPSIEIISQDPIIEYPKQYVFRPSSAVFYERISIRCELLPEHSSVTTLDGVNLIELVQSRDTPNNIKGVDLVVTEISKITDNLYEFELQKSLNYKDLYLPSSTVVTSAITNITSSSNSTISVESTFNFPQNNGRLFVNGKIITYESKTATQFLNCNTEESETVNLNINNQVHLYGRKCSTSGQLSYFINGYIDGNKNSSPVVFRLYGLPSSPIIEKGGSLYSQNVFELELNTLKLNKTILQSKQYSGGEITEVIIENPGNNYKINDKLIIDNFGNPGNGFTAQISSVKGKNLTQYAFSVISDQNCIVFTTSQNHGLQVGDKVKFNEILGNQTIFSIVSNTKFAVENTLNLNTLNLNNLSYITNSRTAVGPIETINISNYGKNYTRLPEVVGVNSQAGSGALIQLNSSKVGNITKFTYDSVGDELIGNKNTKYQIKIPTTAKIINNFVLDSIQVINGGNTYNSVLDKVKVNGIVDSNYEFELIAESGVIRQVNVLRSKSNLTSYPELSIQSNFGNGAVLNPILKRKPLRQGDILTFGSSGSSIKCEVVSFDPKSSTLEYNVISGTISNGEVIYDSLGIAYGTITNISTASAYCKRSPYIKYSSKFLDNLGFISDSSQKIINSDYIQDWSYSITSTRNTKDWKNDVLNNTHVSGFKVFGKNRIENKREFFEAKEEVFNSSVIFKSTLSNLANVNLKQSKSILQKIAIVDASSFTVSDIIYGSFSGSYGIITSISENYIVVNVVSDSKFEFGEYIFKVSIEFILENDNITNYGISFFNGICQEPFNSYYLTTDNYIPRFLVSSADDIVLQELETSFQVVDTRRIGNIVTLTKDLQPLVPTSKDQLLVSINGVLQAQSAYSVSQNILSFNSITLTSTDVLYVLYHPKLKALTFTGTGDTYTLNYTPTSSCNLVIFANGVYQTHLAPISNFTRTENQIQFSDPITDPSTNLVGWYIDETVTCSIVDIGNINDRKIIDTKEVDLQKLTEYLETNNVKTPKSLYEISKDLIEGTLYIENYDTVYGFDTNFMYSNPEYSTSYVEVLDPIVFNGTSYQFPLKYMDGNSYTPINGKTNLVVNIDGNILDPKKYNVVGSNITFQNLYTSANKCTIIDFYSNYIANTSTSAKGIVLDDLNVVQDNSRKTFNLSDRGVPQYVTNTADIFVVKNNNLLIPTSESQSVSGNKITLQTAPTASDAVQLFYFNRQLSPAKTKHVILDSWEYFDGIKKTWPLTRNGILFTPVGVNNLLVCRNGAFQIPGVDYTTSGTNITFDEAPGLSDDIVIIYSYNNINQNSYITSFTAIAEVITVELGLTPPNVYDLLVSRNGVIQNPTEDFTVTGTTLTFTSPVQAEEIVFIVYAHASEEIQISSVVNSTIILSSAIVSGQEDGLVIYVNGIPKFHNKDYTISNGNTITLLNGVTVDPESVPFAIKYVTSFIVDTLGDYQNGTNTKFRLFYNEQNLISSDVLSDADILVSRNNIIQYPGVEYSINVERGMIEFSTPLESTDVVFLVRMYGNTLITLTGVGLQYTLSQSIPTDERENLVIFASNQWGTEESNTFVFDDANTITFNTTHTGNIFGIKFDSSFKLLDQVHTPFNGSNVKFNLFASEENFLPQGTIENNQYPSESSLIVVKDGKLLEPAVDYTLQGDIKSQIQFAVAPSSSSEISVKSVGSFLKLKTLTSVSGTTFNIQKSDNTDYYPNKDIDRPRKLENQVLIFRNGSIQSPLYDYYIDNNKLVFTSSISSSKLVILDFRGVPSDVSVDSVSAGVSIGDKILISGDPDLKVVSSILSPTVMKVTSYIEKGKTYIINVSGTNFTSFGATNNNVGTTFTATTSGVATGIASSVNTKKASGLVVTSNTSGGKITSFNITSGGSNYEDPVIIRTKGVGYNAKGSATIDIKLGNAVVSPIEIESQGYNQYATPVVVPTSYSYVYRQTPVSTSSVQVATKLASSINSTDEIISIANSSRFSSSDIQVVVTSTSGSGAIFRPFVSKGKITKIELISGGSNYNEVDISIDVIGGGGSGCVIEPVLNSSGTITSINLRNSGEGYDSYKVIIDSEIIEYTTIDTTQATPRLFGCTRPSNSTSHNQDTLVYFDEFI
jgi:hypothetical protein